VRRTHAYSRTSWLLSSSNLWRDRISVSALARFSLSDSLAATSFLPFLGGMSWKKSRNWCQLGTHESTLTCTLNCPYTSIETSKLWPQANASVPAPLPYKANWQNGPTCLSSCLRLLDVIGNSSLKSYNHICFKVIRWVPLSKNQCLKSCKSCHYQSII